MVILFIGLTQLACIRRSEIGHFEGEFFSKSAKKSTNHSRADFYKYERKPSQLPKFIIF